MRNSVLDEVILVVADWNIITVKYSRGLSVGRFDGMIARVMAVRRSGDDGEGRVCKAGESQ